MQLLPINHGNQTRLLKFVCLARLCKKTTISMLNSHINVLRFLFFSNPNTPKFLLTPHSFKFLLANLLWIGVFFAPHIFFFPTNILNFAKNETTCVSPADAALSHQESEHEGLAAVRCHPGVEQSVFVDTVSDGKLPFGGFKVETLRPETLNGSS